MASDNPSWGEERVANELKLKLGIRVSSRTVAKYLRDSRPVRTPDPKQRWLTFVHNHAKVIIANGLSASSIYLWCWSWATGGSFTTSLPTQRRNGHCSNFGRPCRTTIRTGF